jgi:hypothetical protein
VSHGLWRKSHPPRFPLLTAVFFRWTAICRGAVLRGLMMNAELPDAVHVESRVTRASYGVRCQRRFNPSTDDESKKYWCAMDCTFKVRTVEWFLEIVSLLLLFLGGGRQG